MTPPTHKLRDLCAFETIIHKHKHSIIVHSSRQVTLLA